MTKNYLQIRITKTPHDFCDFSKTVEKAKSKMLLLIIMCLAVILNNQPVAAQYLHASDKKILDKDGNNIILRGMGLGGWMIQEGYMLETSGFAGQQYKIRAKIEGLIGASNTTDFYNAWLNNNCTKSDIDSLAKWGFNSVRLPMHYNLYTLPVEAEPVAGQNTWLTKGFELTDNLIQWCAANHIYVILDLHATPGGQGNDVSISDRDPSKPSLWDSEANKSKTVALWKKLAERYANEPWVGGYDLINETNWNFTAGANVNGCSETTNAPLRDLYTRIIAGIRSVDTNHLIIIEGNCWANNHNGLLSPKLDPNMAISFHKYWNYNTQGTIQGLLNIRDNNNVPIWLGESGENSNVWFTSAIKLMEANNIGWSWWPLKKVNSIVGPLTVKESQGYSQLLNYWQSGGTAPSVSDATTSLMALTENLKIQNCIYHKDVIDAMFRQVNSAETIPFAGNKVPGLIYATDYDLGRYQYAYYDTDTATLHVSTGGSFTAWNYGYTYRNDGVDIFANTDTQNSNGLNTGRINNGEWLKYSLKVDSTAAYNITVRYAAGVAPLVRLNINGSDQTASVTLPATGGNSAWNNFTIPNVVLYKGMQKLKITFEKGDFSFGSLNFELSKKLTETTFHATTASTGSQGSVILVSLNKILQSSSVTGTLNFTSAINGTAATVTNVQPDPNNQNGIIITLVEGISDSDKITVSYGDTKILATDGSPLQSFNNLEVTNKLPFHLPIPGKIEAEDFMVNLGLQSEACTDTGAGQDVGYTDMGDYMDYRIRVAEAGDYKIESRIACNATSGVMEIQQLTEAGALVGSATVVVPVTGGWQVWQTVTSKITLAEGTGVLRVIISQPGFNMNWFNFTKKIVVISGIHDEQQELKIYPNPTESYLTIDIEGQLYRRDNFLSIQSLTGSTIKRIEHLGPEELQKIYVGDLPTGFYIVALGFGKKVWQQKFVKK